MGSDRLGRASLAASITGLLALICDVINITAFNAADGPSSVLEPLLSIANLAGFLLGSRGLQGHGGGAAALGLHLSWVPFIVILTVLAVYDPALAANLINNLLALVLTVFNAFSEVVNQLGTTGD